MGQPSAEQTVMIIEAVGEATKQPEKKDNYGWLLLIALLPVIVGVLITRMVKK